MATILSKMVGAPASAAAAAPAAAAAASADYKPTTSFLFPGQGAQKVGMCKELVEECPKAKEMFDQASEVLGYDLLAACVEDPDGKLNTTAVSQPAIYVASLAAVEKLRMTEEGAAAIEACDVTAGLSLGEYTALTFAGALTFEDGLKLVKLRGESMQAAADAAPSGMTSVIGLDSEKVAALCARAMEEAGEGNDVRIANYLCPGNYAVSGAIPALEKLEEIAKPEFKARMTVRLAVAGAFHTDFMAPAREQLQAALADTTFTAPRIPVVSNVDVLPHDDPEEIKEILAKQLTSPVQWETTVKTLLEKGMTQSYEIGPGNVIAGIFKRIDKTAPVTNITV